MATLFQVGLQMPVHIFFTSQVFSLCGLLVIASPNKNDNMLIGFLVSCRHIL